MKNAHLHEDGSCPPGWQRSLTPCGTVVVKETSFSQPIAVAPAGTRWHLTTCRSNMLHLIANVLLLTWGRAFEESSRSQVCRHGSPFVRLALRSISLVGSGVDWVGDEDEVMTCPSDFNLSRNWLITENCLHALFWAGDHLGFSSLSELLWGTKQKVKNIKITNLNFQKNLMLEYAYNPLVCLASST